ncbi:MAG: NUDIX domain-containing protein [Chitinophagaceae bacterium]|nr:NUDIX domain-containing protein [Chitinophagaceae bacterium]MBK8494653.1 NUDIX domain-containing protein [Chitinophagaceae bacterium]MBK9530693.1 NUDIX domain-containing protein [Chitinophagaceae bacterium]
MYINIYFGEKPVILCDEIDKGINEILHHPDAVFVDEISPRAIKSMLHEIKKDAFHAGVLWHSDLEKLKETFFKNFKVIEAAGGIVQNEKKEILFIQRLGKWDLPKGKIEKGEKEEQCALREVTEETGVTNLQLKKKVGETYHVYDEFGKHFLKISHWYHMTCSAKQVLKPQVEEHITQIKWVKTRDIKEPVKDTYPSVKDILGTFFDTP